MYMGTKGTLILRREIDAMLFSEGGGELTGLDITPRGEGAVIDASETQPTNRASAAPPRPGAPTLVERAESSRRQIRQFCSAIRAGAALATGPEKAFESARACIRAHEAVVAKARLEI